MPSRTTLHRKIVFCAATLALLGFIGSASAQDPGSTPTVPGHYAGFGTSFQVQGDSLLLSLTASDSVHADIHLAGTEVLLLIERLAALTPTDLQIAGYPPNTTVYALLDSLTAPQVIQTDAQNFFHVTLDTTSSHMLILRLRHNTLTLTGSGWSDPSVGTWDPVTQTGTLTRDVNDQILINDNNLTLEGAGHSCNYIGSGSAVTVSERNGVTIRHLSVLARYDAVYVGNSTSITVTECYLESQLGTAALLNVASGFFRRSSVSATSNTLRSTGSYGIYMYGGFYCDPSGTVIGNDVNAAVPLCLAEGTQGWGTGSIYNNNFRCSGPPVADAWRVQWSKAPPIGGNYWSVWTTPDANGDGFVDSPFVFTGGRDDWPYAQPQAWGATGHTIVASAGPGGAISPSGSVLVPIGADQSFAISPGAGYGIQDVVVDGNSVGAVSSYVFYRVIADHSIAASFFALNRSPVLAAIADQTIDEERPFSLAVTATDPDLPPQPLTFSLLTGPAGMMLDSNSGQLTWTPPEEAGPGDYAVTVAVSDGQSPPLADSASFTVHVREVNRPPVLGALADQTINEMTSFTFTATAIDPDLPANTLAFSLVDAPTGASINSSTGQFEWTPAEDQGPGVYDFAVKVTDHGSPPLSDQKPIRLTVNEVNLPPALAEIPDQAVDELTLLTFTAAATDPDLPANTLAYALEDAIEGMSIDPASGVFTWTPTEAQGPLEVEIGVRVTDDGSPPFSDEKRVRINVLEVNVSPTLTVPGPITVDEGATVSFTPSATDPDVPANTLTFSLVDPPPGATIDGASGAASWPTVDDGSYVLRVSVSDGASGADAEDVPVTVRNVAPTVTITGPAPNLSYEVGSTIGFTGSFTDPGTADTHTAQWSFGALTQAGTVDEATGTVSASYTFNVPGVYPVTLTVTDDDGGAGIATKSGGVDLIIVVYAPDGGSVTAHGWMPSPPGAYLPDPSRSGRATFGVFAHYKWGAAPEGNEEFEFRAAGLMLESTAYEWLVVALPRAQLQGTGTINGTGDYGFLMTALDGDQLRPRGADRLRMKIWDRGTGQLIYDNQLGAPDSCAPTTSIGAGNIVVLRGNSSGGAGHAQLRPALEPASPPPIAFALRPATPNPFRGSIALAFDLPEASDVRLTVHDVTGRQVVELANGALEPGRHERNWEGRDRSGRALEAGVYFVRVEARSLSSAGGLSTVQKIVLIK